MESPLIVHIFLGVSDLLPVLYLLVLLLVWGYIHSTVRCILMLCDLSVSHKGLVIVIVCILYLLLSLRDDG
jgi:hypothetical protein